MDHFWFFLQQEESSPAEEYSACRTTLPVAQPEKSELNLWSFLKQCIGKELTKITMPVQVRWESLMERVTRLGSIIC